MSKLQDKVVLISGGTSGIGAATAKLFHAEGARVIVTGGSSSGVEAARQGLPGVDVIQSDASNTTAIQALVERVAAKYKCIDVLFVNAGISRLIPIEGVDEETYDAILNTNLRGPYFLVKHALPHISEGGSIILTSSTAAVQGMAGATVYAASKAGLRSFGLSLAAELGPKRIRVNTITPGPIQTPIGGKMGLTAEQFAGFGAIIAAMPLQRIGQPDEVAQAALYFASDDSRFTTGAELRIDGGMTV